MGWFKDMLAEVVAESSDRDATRDAATQLQVEAGDEPDSREAFNEAEAQAMADAADEGQIFLK